MQWAKGSEMESVEKSAQWKPTFVVKRGGKWVSNPGEIRPSSFLTASLKVDIYVELLQKYAKGALIDLGCGNAPYFGAYSTANVSSVTWADWDSSYHKGLKKDVVVDLNQPFPLGGDAYATVFMSEVLEHVTYPEATIKEVVRILKPGGVAIVGVPFMYWLHEEPHDFHRFTRHKLMRMASDNGLEVVEFKVAGGGPDVIHDVMMKMAFIKGGKAWTIVGHALVRTYMGLRRVWPLRKLVKRWAGKFPLGYVAVYRKR